MADDREGYTKWEKGAGGSFVRPASLDDGAVEAEAVEESPAPPTPAELLDAAEKDAHHHQEFVQVDGEEMSVARALAYFRVAADKKRASKGHATNHDIAKELELEDESHLDRIFRALHGYMHGRIQELTHPPNLSMLLGINETELKQFSQSEK